MIFLDSPALTTYIVQRARGRRCQPAHSNHAVSVRTELVKEPRNEEKSQEGR
jgi:hypothetical protein